MAPCVANQLDEALRGTQTAGEAGIARIQPHVDQDISDLLPVLNDRAAKRLAEVRADLARVGEMEAKSLTGLLEAQRTRLAKAAAEPDAPQLQLDLDPEASKLRCGGVIGYHSALELHGWSRRRSAGLAVVG